MSTVLVRIPPQETPINESLVSRPQFLAIRTKLVAFTRWKIWIIKVDRFVAGGMLNGPLVQLAPIFTLPCLSNAGHGMLRRYLLVEPASVSGCIVGVAHDVLSKNIDVVGDVTTR